MAQNDQPAIADVVARFFDARRQGRRESIDEALDCVDRRIDRSHARSAALEVIAREVRTNGAALSTDHGVHAEEPTTLDNELPEVDGYDLIDHLGQGGMGVVYEAYQRSTGRRVAIKFLRETVHSGEGARRRFEREVELVARLCHPNIVAVLDSGVYRGQYFFVMDYIEGRPLDELIEPGGSTDRQSLQLIALICDAVDYAHQRGVLHRDLKPSNVVVDQQGKPHLVDFGLAKALDSPADQSVDQSLSLPGQLLGTLAYMSPEQARGEHSDVSLRSDVYSLGAMAYEMTTGQLPIDVDGSLGAALDRIAHHLPPPPSTLTHLPNEQSTTKRTGRWFSRVLRRRSAIDANLDAIFLKTLEKEPEQRYASAGDLGRDLRRWLDGQPVRARRPSGIEQLWRWSRRNPLVATLATTVLLLLVVVAIGSTVSAVRVSAARDDERQARFAAEGARQDEQKQRQRAVQAQRTAKIEAASAEEVSNFLVGLFETADPLATGGYQQSFSSKRGPDVTVREVLDSAAARMDNQLDKQFREQPLVRAKLMDTIGTACWGLGLIEKAEPLLVAAAAIRETNLPEGHADLGASELHLGMLRYYQGDFQQAEGHYQSALEIFEQHAESEPQVATTLFHLAWLLSDRDENDEAEKLLLRSCRIRRELFGRNSRELVTSLVLLTVVKSRQDDLIAVLQYAMQIAEATSDWPEAEQFVLAWNKSSQYFTAVAMQNWEQAEDAVRDTVELCRQVFGVAHPATVYVMRAHCTMLRRQEKFEKADVMLQEAIRIAKKIVADKHPYLANLFYDLALVKWEQGLFDPAMRYCVKASDIYIRSFGPDHPRVHYLLSDIAKLQFALGYTEQYRKTCRRLLTNVGDATPPYLANEIAWCCALGRDSLADPNDLVPLIQAAVDLDPEDPNMRHTLGAVLYRAGQYEECIKELQLGFGDNEDELIDPLYSVFLAMANAKMGHLAAADDWLGKLVGRKGSTQTTGALTTPNSPVPLDQLVLELLINEAREVVAKQHENITGSR